MIRIYRVMSSEEFNKTSVGSYFSWNSKCKWFTGNLDFIKQRVMDGKFNNSNFKEGKYKHLIEYLVEDIKGVLIKVSDNEVMLRRKDAPLIKVVSMIKHTSFECL